MSVLCIIGALIYMLRRQWLAGRAEGQERRMAARLLLSIHTLDDYGVDLNMSPVELTEILRKAGFDQPRINTLVDHLVTVRAHANNEGVSAGELADMLVG